METTYLDHMIYFYIWLGKKLSVGKTIQGRGQLTMNRFNLLDIYYLFFMDQQLAD